MLISMFLVFYPWLLYLIADNPLLGQNILLPPLIEINKEGEIYLIDKVLNLKIDRRINNPAIGE